MIEDGEADALLVAKLDRLTRSLTDLGVLLEGYFGDHPSRVAEPASLLSVGEQISTGTASGRMVLNILMSVSQWEREAIAERTRAALASKKAKGEHVSGPVPFGYALGEDGKRLLQHPMEYPAVRRMITMRTSGTSFGAIARTLNSEGVPSRGKAWSPAAVRRVILRHEGDTA